MMLESLPTPEKPWNQRWAILLRPLPGSQEENAKPRMIGIIGIVREQEIGYKVHPDFWGKRYMTEALKMFINMYWKMEGKISFPLVYEKSKNPVNNILLISIIVNTNYDKLIAASDPGNPASLRILEKAGFQKGEYKTDFYERVVDGLVIKGDLQFFYLPRPYF
jgi:ribosomal-protein-alanine N-acetyltransferase